MSTLVTFLEIKTDVKHSEAILRLAGRVKVQNWFLRGFSSVINPARP